jgi:DNA topoisomerase-1
LVKNFGNILDYNFTAKVEQDFDEIAEESVWSKMMQEFYDQFHPNVKDVEANAERESGENLGTDPKTGKPVSVRLEIWPNGTNRSC